MYISIKDIDQLQAEALENLQSTPIRDAGPGSIVRLLLACVNSVLADCYNQLKTAHLGSFVSTAEGEFLDLLGDIIHCARRSGESDEEYRYRITSQTLVDAAANRTALRLAALSVDGVRDVLLSEYAGGAGSLALYVVIDDLEQQENILSEVSEAVEEVRGNGIRVEILTPRLIRIGLRLGAVLRGGVPEHERAAVLFTLSEAAADYVNSLYPGKPLLINDLIAKVLDVSTYGDNGKRDVLEIKPLSLSRDGQEIDIEDQHCRWNERFVEDSIQRIEVV